MVHECALGSDCKKAAPDNNFVRKFTVKIQPNGNVVIDWWHPEVNPLLDKLGVPDDDPNRTQWCG